MNQPQTYMDQTFMLNGWEICSPPKASFIRASWWAQWTRTQVSCIPIGPIIIRPVKIISLGSGGGELYGKSLPSHGQGASTWAPFPHPNPTPTRFVPFSSYFYFHLHIISTLVARKPTRGFVAPFTCLPDQSRVATTSVSKSFNVGCGKKIEELGRAQKIAKEPKKTLNPLPPPKKRKPKKKIKTNNLITLVG